MSTDEKMSKKDLRISKFSLLISFIVCIFTVILYYSQYQQIQNQNLPNLKILSVISDKSYPTTASIYEGKYCRIYSGETTSNLSLDGMMAVFNVEDEQIEEGFIDEVKSHIGKNDIYFTYFGLQPYLIINQATSQDNSLLNIPM